MSRFKGKASVAYNSTSDERASQSDLVKYAVLRAYELRPEAYRLRHSELKKTQGQSNSEFAAKKLGLFDKWVACHQIESYRVTGIVDLTGH